MFIFSNKTITKINMTSENVNKDEFWNLYLTNSAGMTDREKAKYEQYVSRGWKVTSSHVLYRNDTRIEYFTDFLDRRFSNRKVQIPKELYQSLFCYDARDYTPMAEVNPDTQSHTTHYRFPLNITKILAHKIGGRRREDYPSLNDTHDDDNSDTIATYDDEDLLLGKVGNKYFLFVDSWTTSVYPTLKTTESRFDYNTKQLYVCSDYQQLVKFGIKSKYRQLLGIKRDITNTSTTSTTTGKNYKKRNVKVAQ